MKLFLTTVLFIFIIVPFFALSLKFLTIDPPVFPDEAYLYTSSQHLREKGYLSTQIYDDSAPGSPEIRAYSYPPLYPYLLNFWTNARGNTIDSVRWLSLIISTGTLVIFCLLLIQLTLNPMAAAFGTILLYLSAPYGMASRIGRMEILVVFFMVLALLCWTRFCLRKKMKWAVMAGVAAGMAALTHQLGSFVPLILLILIHAEKTPRKQKLLTILYAGFPIVMAYLIWFLSVSDRLDLFISQLQVGFLYKAGRPSLLLSLVKNDVEWACLIILYSLSILSGVILAVKTKNRFILGLSLSAGLVIGIVTVTVEQWYFVYVPIIPLILFVCIFSFAIKSRNFPIIVTSMLSFVLMGFLQLNIMWQGISSQLSKPPSYSALGEAVSKQISPGSQVVLSTLPDPYFALQNRFDLQVFAVPNIAIPQQFTKLLNNTDVVVVNYITNQQLKEYIEKNGVNVININAGGYKTSVVILKPKGERE